MKLRNNEVKKVRSIEITQRLKNTDRASRAENSPKETSFKWWMGYEPCTILIRKGPLYQLSDLTKTSPASCLWHTVFFGIVHTAAAKEQFRKIFRFIYTERTPILFFDLCRCSMWILHRIPWEPIRKRCRFRFRSNVNEPLKAAAILMHKIPVAATEWTSFKWCLGEYFLYLYMSRW